MGIKTVFISYRRDSLGKALTGRISDSLASNNCDVFIDVEGLGSGEWENNLYDEIRERNHFIIVVTKDSLLRCSDSEDILRKEYELAEKLNKNIVPVFEESINDTEFKNLKKSCPECMLGIFDQNICSLKHNSWKTDINVLINRFISNHKINSDAARLPIVIAKSSTPEDYFKNLWSSVRVFADNLLSLLILVSFILFLMKAPWDDSREYVYFMPLTVTIRGFWSMLSLEKEDRNIVFLALLLLAGGLTILSGKFKYRKSFDDVLAIISFSGISFSIGAASVIAIRTDRNG